MNVHEGAIEADHKGRLTIAQENRTFSRAQRDCNNRHMQDKHSFNTY